MTSRVEPKRERVIGFRATSQEERLLTWAAKAEGIGRSELLRRAIVEYLDGVHRRQQGK